MKTIGSSIRVKSPTTLAFGQYLGHRRTGDLKPIGHRIERAQGKHSLNMELSWLHSNPAEDETPTPRGQLSLVQLFRDAAGISANDEASEPAKSVSVVTALVTYQRRGRKLTSLVTGRAAVNADMLSQLQHAA